MSTKKASKITCVQYSISWWNAWLLSYERVSECVLLTICKFYCKTDKNKKILLNNTTVGKIIGKVFSLKYSLVWMFAGLHRFTFDTSRNVHLKDLSQAYLWSTLISFQKPFRESSFNMTRGNEVIETQSLKF